MMFLTQNQTNLQTSLPRLQLTSLTKLVTGSTYLISHRKKEETSIEIVSMDAIIYQVIMPIVHCYKIWLLYYVYRL